MSKATVTKADIIRSDGWIHLVAMAGDRGRAWAEEFQARGAENLIESIHDAINLMLKRRLDEGWELLKSIEPEHTELARAEDDSFLDAYRPWYHSATAYYFYGRNDFDRADAEITAVTNAVRRACEAKDFLIVLATRCCDTELQRARMHRNYYRWQAVADHLSTGHDMIESTRPLCTLRDGRTITFTDLRAWAAALPYTSEEHREAVDSVLASRRWRLRYRGLVAELYALPWLIIPYG